MVNDQGSEEGGVTSVGGKFALIHIFICQYINNAIVTSLEYSLVFPLYIDISTVTPPLNVI